MREMNWTTFAIVRHNKHPTPRARMRSGSSDGEILMGNMDNGSNEIGDAFDSVRSDELK